MTKMDDMDRPEGQDPLPGDGSASPPGGGAGRRFRRNAVAVGAALGLTLGGLGIAAAQTASTDSSTTSSTTAPAAAAPPAAGAPADPGTGDPGRHGHGPGLAAAARAIGVSEADLSTALRSGQSIAQVAQSKNVDVKVVIAAMLDEAKAQEAAEAATLEQRITDAVNHAGGPGGSGGPGRHGPGGP